MRDHNSEAARNSDIVDGWRFSATLQLRTPLKYLRMHGMRVPIDSGPPPDVPMRHGCWIVTLKTFAQLGIPIPEIELHGVCASEIGPVPSDGGEFLVFAKQVRSLIEATDCAQAGAEKLRSLLTDKSWQEFTDRLGGVEKIVRRFYKPVSRKDQTLAAIFEVE